MCSAVRTPPEDPDWRILSAQGAALDQLGRNEEAQQYYATALKIVPDEPQVLSNLGLSYVLQNNLPRAEETMRRAYERNAADPRVRANLAMVLWTGRKAGRGRDHREGRFAAGSGGGKGHGAAAVADKEAAAAGGQIVR